MLFFRRNCFIINNSPALCKKKKDIQGNRGDLQKIYVTRQFFEASGRQGDFFTCIRVYILCHASPPNEKQYRPEIRHSYSHWLYLKRVFCFLEEITLTAASLDKLPCHVDFPHISSIALFLIFSQSQANFQVFVRSFPSPFSREQLQSELIFIINNISVSLCWKCRYSCCIFLV